MADTTTTSSTTAAADYSAFAHWALRLALASVFLFHGLSKFGNLQGGAEMMGLPVVIWLLVALGEAGGGLLVLIGGFLRENRWGDIATRLGAAMLIPIMLGAIFMVHWGQWSFQSTESHPMGGMEFQVTLLLIQIYLLLRGNNA